MTLTRRSKQDHVTFVVAWHTEFGGLALHPGIVGAHGVRPENRQIYSTILAVSRQ
ncbi:hypothetical protein [Coleofasciculus sp.]|uniref:hypothetical protein n=1 Tax=Coleofasciculus sp. TaxID=3100458 RepID=UPI0039FAFB57